MKIMQSQGHLMGSTGGFTLVELVIVIGMVGLFLPAMFTTMQTALSDADQVQAGHQQLTLAEGTMEEIMADCRAKGLGFTFLTPANYSPDTGMNGYTRSIEVEDIRVEGRPAKAVTVRVVREGFSDVSLTMTYIENW
jgi:type II secretory pathway pseudopilin PulG